MTKLNRLPLRVTLTLLGLTQLIFGLIFIIDLDFFLISFGLDTPTTWVQWMFAGAGARTVAFGYGMFLAARKPTQHVHWIQAMIGVQLVDWLSTIHAVSRGILSVEQAGGAMVFPLLYVILLVVFYPRHLETQRLSLQENPDVK